MRQEIIDYINSISNKTRLKKLSAKTEYITWLNDTYPGVPLLLQTQALLYEKPPYCVICGSVKKEIHKHTCSKSCGQKYLKDSGKLEEKLIKRFATIEEKYGALIGEN